MMMWFNDWNFAAWRLGVMLALLIVILSLTLTVGEAQYPTMIPVTDELLTVQPTTQPKRVQGEGMKDEGGKMQEEKEGRWIVFLRSVCIGVVFVGSLVGMVVVLWRKTR